MDFRLPSSKEEYPALISALSNYSQEEQRVIMAELGRKDLFFFTIYILNRKDLFTDWHMARAREIQREPDGVLNLWFRGSGKTSLITHSQTIWNIMQNPEITIGIVSWSRRAAIDIVKAIKTELESNELLKELYPDVLYDNPDVQSLRWSDERGLIVKRTSNKREATIEGTGLDTQLTGRHFDILVYDDIVSVNNVTSNEVIQNTTNALLTSFNLVSRNGKKRFIGTRYHTVDTYDYLIKNKIVIPRIYPATIDGTPDGEPCEIITKEQLEEKRKEMSPYIFSCHCAGTKITMADWTLKNIEDVKVGDEVVGFTLGRKEQRGLFVKTKVLATGSGIKPCVRSYMFDGTICQHSKDHLWYTGRAPEQGRRLYSELGLKYHQQKILQQAHSINIPQLTEKQKMEFGYLCGMIDGEGACEYLTLSLSQETVRHKYICDRIKECLKNLKIDFLDFKVKDRDSCHIVLRGGKNMRIKLLNWDKVGLLAKRKQIEKQCFSTKNFKTVKLMRQENIGKQVVYRIQTETGNYLANGFGSKNCQMLLNPVSDDERRFNPQLFQYYDKASLDKLTKNVYITVDAATSKKKGSDYSALAVMAVDALDNVYLVDLVKDKLNLDERKKKLFELVLKYKPLVVGYERYALMADTDYIRKCQETENIRFPIVELGGKLSKIERVDRFVPTFSNRKFYIPESLEYRDFEGKSHDLIQELKYEMINFPKGHDDCIDAISRIKDPELGVITPNAAGANSGVQEFAKFEFEL